MIAFLFDKGPLPPERARMLRGWVHSGFNVHRGRRVLSCERKDMERLAQYIIRNPFSVEKMWATRAGPGFGIRIDPLPLRHKQEDRAQLRGLHPLRLYRGDHPTHCRQELPASPGKSLSNMTAR